MKTLLTGNNRPDAILVISWDSVPVIMQMLERFKIKFPEDFGIIVATAELYRLKT